MTKLDGFAIGPVKAGFHIDFQRDAKCHDVLHFVADEFGEVVDFALGNFEDELVVNLEEQFARAIVSCLRRRWMASIASLIMSAAEPWMTLLTAVRSGSVSGLAARAVGAGARAGRRGGRLGLRGGGRGSC